MKCPMCKAETRVVTSNKAERPDERTRVCKTGHRFITKETMLREIPTSVSSAEVKLIGITRFRLPQQREGDKFGEWTLVDYKPGSEKRKSGEGVRRMPAWLCVCSCGVERVVRTDNLVKGASKSCGHDRANKAWK